MMRMIRSIESRPRNHGAALARTALLTVSAMTLLSCSQSSTSSLAECQREADRFYQGYQTDDAANPRSKYLIECMASRGYEFDISSAQCDSRRSLPAQSTCYVSENWVARKLET